METGYSFPRSFSNEDEIPLPRRAAFFADVEYIDNTEVILPCTCECEQSHHVQFYLPHICIVIHPYNNIMPMYILQSDTHVLVCCILCNPSMNTMLTVCWPNALIVVLYDSWPVGF